MITRWFGRVSPPCSSARRPERCFCKASDSAGGLRLAAMYPDLDAVFIDLAMSGLDGMNALQEFARVRPALPIIALTAADSPALARRAFAAGALGYVPKSASAETLVTALNFVLRGETFVPSLAVRLPTAARNAPGGTGLCSRTWPVS